MTKRICTICARGGSKGVPGKNIRLIAGKPLIAHSIDQAKATGLFEAVAVSSDSDEILAVAEKFGADLCVQRPDELATDTAGKLPAIIHCFETAEQKLHTQFDVICDLDATSPLRIADDIEACLRLQDKPGTTNVITAAPARRSPYFNMVELDANQVARLSKPLPNQVVRRQDAPACFDMNASIYVWSRAHLLGSTSIFQEGTRLHVMPEERSIDIDSELDSIIVEHLFSQRSIA